MSAEEIQNAKWENIQTQEDYELLSTDEKIQNAIYWIKKCQTGLTWYHSGGGADGKIGCAGCVNTLESIEKLLESEKRKLRGKIEKRIEHFKSRIKDCDEFLKDDYDEQTTCDRGAYKLVQKELEALLSQLRERKSI